MAFRLSTPIDLVRPARVVFGSGSLDEPGQVILLLTRVDEWVLVVVKQSEKAVQANIHAGWL